jgi:single-stranded DNA-binding protein
MSEFNFQGQGTLKRIDTFTSKAGKTILTLICETDGQYPQLVPIKVFGRLAEQAASWKPGMVLSVSGRLGGRDWQGKVFGDIVANSVEVVRSGSGKADLPDDDFGPPPRDLDEPPF